MWDMGFHTQRCASPFGGVWRQTYFSKAPKKSVAQASAVQCSYHSPCGWHEIQVPEEWLRVVLLHSIIRAYVLWPATAEVSYAGHFSMDLWVASWQVPHCLQPPQSLVWCWGWHFLVCCQLLCIFGGVFVPLWPPWCVKYFVSLNIASGILINIPSPNSSWWNLESHLLVVLSTK